MCPIYISIDKKELHINISEKITEIKEKELIEIFSIIHSFKIIETNNGNEYEKAWIKIKYKENMVISEYINIFNLVRIPDLYNFIKYFKTIKEKFDSQSSETKINLEDYVLETENISQKIIIKMVFTIEARLDEIEKKAIKLKELMKITDSDKEIFKIVEKDLNKEKW